MRLRIEPQPTPQEAQAIAAAVETLLGRYGHGCHTGERSVRWRFDDMGGDDTFHRDDTWRGLARIEALKSGV